MDTTVESIEALRIHSIYSQTKSGIQLIFFTIMN